MSRERDGKNTVNRQNHTENNISFKRSQDGK